MDRNRDKDVYGFDVSETNFRQHPERYTYKLFGKGEQGVLVCSPFSDEVIAHWKFKTPQEAKESSQKIYSMFLNYVKKGEFIGADIARKALQMGFTRSMRYYHHSNGRKYIGAVPDDKKGLSGAHGREEAPKDYDPEKKKSADIFYPVYEKAKDNPAYQKMREEWKAKG